MPKLTVLGAAGTVTGSKYLISTANGANILVDCGLFQGETGTKARNWEHLPFPLKNVNAVVLTHAHIDHTGYLPKLSREGYTGPVYCTTGTADLAAILLPDAGYLQEEEAAHANRKGWSRHKPALPLFTQEDAKNSLQLLQPVHYFKEQKVADGVTVRFIPAGHIIGSAIVEMTILEGRDKTVIVFSGDLGRRGAPLLKDPTKVAKAHYLLVESTYGDRTHAPDPQKKLVEVINRVVEKEGMLLIPAFSVGRTQELLYVIRQLEEHQEIPILDVFVDSPMAIEATNITMRHTEEFDEEFNALLKKGIKPLKPHRLKIVHDADHSKSINYMEGPGIIISASGMCSGGRIKHHLKQRLPHEKNTVCLIGYQAIGTRGRQLLDGAEAVTIFGEKIPVHAEVTKINGYSAHADLNDLMDWLSGFEQPPLKTFLIHGEDNARGHFAGEIQKKLGWNTVRPNLGESFDLAPGEKIVYERIKRP